jgi:hypothetical protein
MLSGASFWQSNNTTAAVFRTASLLVAAMGQDFKPYLLPANLNYRVRPLRPSLLLTLKLMLLRISSLGLEMLPVIELHGRAEVEC